MTKSLARPRNLPFLHRNWITALNYLQSAALGSNHEDSHAKITNGDDDHYLRPAKRRRFAESSPDSGIGQDIDTFVLHDEPVETQRAMRIEVLRITQKATSRGRPNGIPNGTIAPSIKDGTSVRARCKITITAPSWTPGDVRTLYCDSQICTIQTFQSPVSFSRMARVYLPQPFHVPEDKIYVEREDDAVFDLADTYAVTVELESAGDHNWPPLNLSNSVFGEDVFVARPSPRQWTLAAEIPNILDRGRRSGYLKLHKGAGQAIRTDFVVDIDVRWATTLPERLVSNGQERPSVSSAANFYHQEESLSLTNGHVNGNHVNGHHANGHLTNGHSNLDEDMEDEVEGELTPSRSLRIRGTKNYNLKVLSAQAQGKEFRKRSRNVEAKKADGDRVLYHMPRETLPVKEVVIDGFACCVCHAQHQSLVQLRAHLVSHAQYKFEVNPMSGKPGCQIDVSCLAVNSGPFLRPRIYQLGKPTKSFELDKYIEGDESWVTSRLGPNNDDGPIALAVDRKVSQTKPVQTRAIQRTTIRRKEKKVLVPATRQQLFDPLSKARLVPGTEVRQPMVDETWLIQKHRDIVQDFIDVDPAEKEYIKEWDAFIQKRHISSDAYISRAVLDFVNEKLQWLLASKSRTQELGKHLTVLIVRGLDDETIRLIQARLQEGRNQKIQGIEKAPPAEPSKEARHRSSRGCAVCGRPVRGPRLLVCSNKDCKKPLYHDDCIKDTARMPVDQACWLCNECTH